MKHKRLWITWLSLSLAASLALGYTLQWGSDRRLFMPGPLTDGHHQIGLACDACHGEAFDDAQAMQERCIACHGDQRAKPLDSHPPAKFKDPRNADRLAVIDVLRCVTCHVEHQPEITHEIGFTRPADFCVHCHQDIGEERPSHAGMEFSTCRDAGCHNFHNNRALYTDFLIKHRDKPALLERRGLPEREYGQILDELMDYPHARYPVRALGLADQDAPADQADESQVNDWLGTAHAQAGVNCSACHQPPDAEGQAGSWTDHPGQAGCKACHQAEIESFGRGLHGMRQASGLAPMTPALARLPMRGESAHVELNCTTCHAAHDFDLQHAAVEACLGCHDDAHSRAYKESAHYELWRRAVSGELPQEQGVSCAGCHMPRVNHDVNDWVSRVLVQHNQSATLQPNEKMIRPVCLHCHGLGFSIDALADRRLIDNNFRGKPGRQVKSLEMAEAVHLKALEEIGEEF